MLEGFNSPDFGVAKDSDSKRLDPEQYFNTFKTLKSAHSKSFLTQNPSSFLARFTRTKYLNLVQAKMECSSFGNLDQRKLVTFGGFPDTTFFHSFCSDVLACNYDTKSSLFVSGDYSSGQSMDDELVVEDKRVYFDFDEVNGYGGNLSDHDLAEGVGLGGVGVVEA
ncbi:hypothetical protein J1N35_023350 [Gossypium stocksii]|uniref:Uncharacterized protein n=1 Tax=Gossypium stocksii TaxID=47602 RepID=A0A9D4A4C1_9ROSI|nr:hypothetical protein J1N35_023350 [Gossypium stocksii]